ncbi:MAG TPA: 16S rRNA (guanine(966)-N(2))-methyltransferase RsmD [Gemmatimonadaceae bacterium]|jgi:16S rRNA (guanine966-N2)-methyltransferase|nr:16S rRNA (guanine(966)-N(2))-methyltransferase RsmD [Gemmatimonadaceae bacterium]
MRIVAGRWRGRRIRPPDDTRVRPTADRVREAWMSIVMPDLGDARVLDLFAGSGALGIEALSRGAASADLVEVSASGVRAIRENAELLGAGDELRVHRGDAMKFIEQLDPHAFDVAFADPPYGHGLAKAVAEHWLVVPFATVLGIEHASKEQMPEGDTRRYGDTAITFYRTGSPRSS